MYIQEEQKLFDELMICYLSGTISDKEKQQLSDLLQTSETLRKQYAEMIKTRAISYIPSIEAQKESNFQLLKKQMDTHSPIHKQHIWFSYIRQIAAAILLILSTSVASYYLYKDISTSNDMLAVYETVVPSGSMSKITLPDQTVVWLNAGSVLKYNQSFGKKLREVHLTGEGYFEVKKDTNKPFLVHTNELEVKVLGTVFNVRAYQNNLSVEVDLLEGKVDVSSFNGKTHQTLTMLPNEKIIYNKENHTMQTHKVDANKSTLWKTGKLSFIDTSLPNILKDLERKFNIRISIQSKKMEYEKFTGSINLNLSLDEILHNIDVDKKYKWEKQDEMLVIRDR